MQKRLLAALLAVASAFSLCACSEKGEEIATGSFDIDKNIVLNEGFGNFKDRLNAIYDEPDDLINYGGQNTIPIVEFDDAVYVAGKNSNFYTRFLYYTLVEIKSSDISNAALYGINAKDDPSFWNSFAVDTDKTRKELVLEKAKNAAYYSTVANAVMEEYGFKKSDTHLLSYQNLLTLYGNEQAIRDHYAAYGLGDNYLLPYLEQYSAYSEFREYLVGIDGKMYPTDEEAKQFFKDECLYFEQIVFSYVYTDENGYICPKTAEDITESRKKGETVYAEILADERMFDRNMHLTEHSEWSENVYGYTYIPNEILPELEEAYFKLAPGEITAVETSLGYYIIRALEKTDKAFEDSNSRIIDAYCDITFKAEMNKHADKISINDSEFSKYTFEDVLVFNN